MTNRAWSPTIPLGLCKRHDVIVVTEQWPGGSSVLAVAGTEPEMNRKLMVLYLSPHATNRKLK